MDVGRGLATRLRRTHAGTSAFAQFRAHRREEMRARWRDWAMLFVVIGVSVLAVTLTTDVLQLVFAGVVGALITVAVVGWLVGGHARSLTWAWGAAGERDTAATLDALDETWACIHDVPRERGNWDHILVGPPGVLLLDTKLLTARLLVYRATHSERGAK